MTPEQQIERLFKKHKQWISFARSYLSDANMMHAEDVIQECYIKILRILRADPDKVIQDNYFFNTIKTMILDDKREPQILSNTLKRSKSGTHPKNPRKLVLMSLRYFQRSMRLLRRSTISTNSCSMHIDMSSDQSGNYPRRQTSDTFKSFKL